MFQGDDEAEYPRTSTARGTRVKLSFELSIIRARKIRQKEKEEKKKKGNPSVKTARERGRESLAYRNSILREIISVSRIVVCAPCLRAQLIFRPSKNRRIARSSPEFHFV